MIGTYVKTRHGWACVVFVSVDEETGQMELLLELVE